MPFLNIAVSSSIIGNESFLVCFLNMWSFFTCDTHESWQKNWGPPRYKSYNFWCYSLAPQTLESCAGIDKFPMRELFSCNSITQHISHVMTVYVVLHEGDCWRMQNPTLGVLITGKPFIIGFVLLCFAEKLCWKYGWIFLSVLPSAGMIVCVCKLYHPSMQILLFYW